MRGQVIYENREQSEGEMRASLQPVIGVALTKQTSLIVVCPVKERAEHGMEASVGGLKVKLLERK